jgi:acetyl-CoA carboxylase biotin carboxyl carrier protein
MNYADLIQIVELLRQSEQFSSFKLKTPELELEVQRGTATVETPSQAAGPVAAPTAAPTAAALANPAPGNSAAGAAQPSPGPAHATPSPQELEPARVQLPPATPSTWRPVKSPMVGTFYAAPEPGAAPFVQPGQAVRAGDVLCIIEVMKLMNTLRAEFDGTVREIAVRDAQPLEYGQLLMQVEPA